MPRKKIDAYEHAGKERLNNPPAGLVTPDTDPDLPQKTYAFDPHLDPQLQWAGKAERTSFDVPTLSLHVHERIDPRTIDVIGNRVMIDKCQHTKTSKHSLENFFR